VIISDAQKVSAKARHSSIITKMKRQGLVSLISLMERQRKTRGREGGREGGREAGRQAGRQAGRRGREGGEGRGCNEGKASSEKR
jgi:hypothetical protein